MGQSVNEYYDDIYSSSFSSPLTDKQLEILYPTIRMKMGVALNKWQPSDSSALIILRPWIKVRGRGGGGEMESITFVYVLLGIFS